MSISTIFLTIILSLVTTAIIYVIFENMGTLGGFVFCYIAAIINAFLSGTSPIGGLIFIAGIIPALIETVIYKAIYDRSNSLGEFMKKCVIIIVIIGVIIFGVGFSISKIAENNSKKKYEEKIQMIEDAKNIVDCGEYTLGNKINFGNKYTYKITKIVTANEMSYEAVDIKAGKKVYKTETYYPEDGKTFIWMQYYVDNESIPTDMPAISLESASGEKYYSLYQVSDSKSNKKIDISVLFNKEDDKAKYQVFEVPIELVNNKNCYITISERYRKGEETLINRFSYTLK